MSASYWSANGPGSDGVTADSGVVMLGTEGWLWEAAPQSGLAKVVCQRGEFRESGKGDGERYREKKIERETSEEKNERAEEERRERGES